MGRAGLGERVVSQGQGSLQHHCPKARGTSQGGCSLPSPRAAAPGHRGVPPAPRPARPVRPDSCTPSPPRAGVPAAKDRV